MKFSDLHCLFCKVSRIIGLCAISLIILFVQNDPLSGQKRLIGGEHALEIIKNNFLFGTGLGHYLFAEAKFPLHYSYFFLQPVHNVFLLFLSQGGILLMGYLLFVIYKFSKSNFQSIIFNLPSYILPLLVILITGMFDHYWLTLQQNLLLMGVVGGFALSKGLKS